METIRVTVWGENRHEQIEPHVAAIYPDGMHNTLAAGISENLGDRARVTTTTLYSPTTASASASTPKIVNIVAPSVQARI